MIGIDTVNLTLRIVGIVDHAVDDGGIVLAERDDQGASWKLAVVEMHGATTADVHRRRPHPSQARHVVLEPLALMIDAEPGCPFAAPLFVPSGLSLTSVTRRHRVIDLNIGKTCRYRNRASDTISGLPFEASAFAPTVIGNKSHREMKWLGVWKDQ